MIGSDFLVLDLLSLLSKKLYWSKPIAVFLGLFFIGLVVVSLLGLCGRYTDVLLIPSLLSMLWLALYFVMLTMFSAVPLKPEADLKLFVRLKIRLQRMLYYFLALLLLVLTVVIIFLTFRLFSIWLAGS